MIEEDRYCIDVVTQAIRAALRRAEEGILSNHVTHCVDGAIESADRAEQRRNFAELMDVISCSDVGSTTRPAWN